MPREQRMLAYLESVVYDNRSGPAAWLIRHLLSLLSSIYSASIKLYIFFFDSGIRKRHRLGRPVISIGNITVGGTGKTPVVQYVVRELLSVSKRPAILSYGYGSALAGRYGVVSDRDHVILDASMAGDEPVMLAESLPGCPVIVCRHRHISGKRAISEFDADVLVLDDGFQVWKLHRDLDIVLLAADNLFDNGRTLPAGKLREPISALKRVGCIIVTGCGDPEFRENAAERIRNSGVDSPIFYAEYIPQAFIELSSGRVHDSDILRGNRVLAVSSIGNPSSFEKTLESTGAQMVGTHKYPDHHMYTEDDVSEIMSDAISASADVIVTTMKDAVKLTEFLFDLPVYVLTIKVSLSDKDEFRELLTKIMRDKG